MNRYKFGLYGINPSLKELEEKGSPFLPVRVVHTILDSNDPEWSKHGGWDSLGAIKFIPMYASLDDNDKTVNIAKPLYPNFKQYPLKDEITWVIQLPDPSVANNPNYSSFYYINIINIWNHPHHNALPNIDFNRLPENLKLDYKEIETGLVKKETDKSKDFKLGETFVEKSTIKPLLPFEGDVIYEGRWGQSFRFGSTVLGKNPWSVTGSNGDPILIIRNGQSKNTKDAKKGWIPTIEDINGDGGSIYFTEGQAIPIKVASNNLKSFGSQIQEITIPKINIPDNPVNPTTQSLSSIDKPPTSSITDNVTSSIIITSPSVTSSVSSSQVFKEEQVIFSFPGEDTQEFIFDTEQIDEESNEAAIKTEKYNASIISSEGPQTKNESGNYAIYRNGIPEYLPVEYFEQVRIVKKYSPNIKLIIESARKEGANLKINSGFRTYDEQLTLRKQNIIDKSKVNDNNVILNGSSKLFSPQTAKPGFSKHQSGTAYDFNTADSTVYKWLVKNASKYGFIRTVASEKWHWEYIPNTNPFAFVPKSDTSWENLV